MALAKVNSQYQSRRLYFELGQQKEIGQKLNTTLPSLDELDNCKNFNTTDE